MAENKLSSISKADSDEKIGEFWDSHDFTEFDTAASDAEFEIISTVPVQLELLNEIGEHAAKRGVKVETLVKKNDRRNGPLAIRQRVLALFDGSLERKCTSCLV